MFCVIDVCVVCDVWRGVVGFVLGVLFVCRCAGACVCVRINNCCWLVIWVLCVV